MPTLAEDLGRIPALFFDNHYSNSGYTITASNEISGYEKTYAYDGKTHTQWGFTSGATRTLKVDAGSGSTVYCDYLAIAYHNLATVGASITVEKSPDNSSWTTVVASFAASAGPIIKLFASTAARYWRISISGLTGSGYIGMVYLGARTNLPSSMPVGFTPAKFARKDRLLISESEGAHMTGMRSLSQINEVTIPLKYLTASWVESIWPTIQAALVSKPVFFLHDTDNYSTQYFVGWIAGDIPQPKYDTTATYSLDIPLRGLSA
jgi:hypothetical protein